MSAQRKDARRVWLQLFLLFLSAAACPRTLAGSADGTDLAVLLEDPRLQQALRYAASREPETLEAQIALCEIASPTFSEMERASDFQVRLRRLGIASTSTDATGNVVAQIPGTGGGPLVVLAAHLDTVFPEGIDVRVRREEGVLHGPGIGDDCRGLAVLLAVADAVRAAELPLKGSLLLVATVGEEGLGNLEGVRGLFTEELRERTGFFVAVDGAGSGLTHVAVGSRRFQVVFRGPGGHSYGAFGLPNPAQAAARAILGIGRMELPSGPKSTFNVGLIQGGTSINSIPAEVSFAVDLRSEDEQALEAMVAQFEEAVRAALEEENRNRPESERLTVTVESLGVRPAGRLEEGSPLLEAALGAARHLGFEPQLRSGSTDANLPLSLGIPAIAINGGGEGRGAHSVSESFHTRDSHLGTQWALLLAVALAGLEGEAGS